MRRAMLLFALVGVLPVSALADSLELRGGAVFPRASGQFFGDVSDLYTRGRVGTARPPGVARDDWRWITGGVEFGLRVGDNLELGFHVDGYQRTLQTSYRDYVRDSQREIAQSLQLAVVPLGMSVRLVSTSRRARIAPYVAVGVDAVYWKYEEFGDFIDFDSPRRPRPIIADSFKSEGVAPGFHVAGGLRVPVGDDVSITSEVRYLWARDDMGNDFRGNRIQLSGINATVGIHLRF